MSILNVDIELQNLSLSMVIGLFVLLAGIIAYAGTYLSRSADRLADMTGIGEALFGAILLGGLTSLPGIITSVTTAYEGYPQLSVSNAIGGIAAQTLFLAISDISYRKANLEHAAASFANLMQGVLLISLLSFILVVISGPSMLIMGVHPASLILLLAYIFGTRLISSAKDLPMWKPTHTSETVTDIPDQENINRLSKTTEFARFFLLAAIVGLAGWGVARTGISLAERTALSESFVGSFFTAISTSLPELIVSIAAVRQGALTLAVANVIGGNTFDILFVAFSDFAYRDGSIYHALSRGQEFTIGLTIVMTSVLLLGLLHRQKKGFGGIGWESVLMILIFIAGYIYLYTL